MLAVVTGHAYDVFDFDEQNGGHLSEFLAYFASLGHRSLTVQGIVSTPSGGYHLYVLSLERRKTPIARGVDYQGQRGIAFIPPSRKRSKTSGGVRSYRWSEWSPCASDDGEAIYDALAHWPGHAYIPNRSEIRENGTGIRGITKEVVRNYRKNGIPPDENHDSTLSAITWSLCLWGATEAIALEIWQTIVDQTEPKAGKRPFEASRDFQRHWNGAVRKLR